MKKLFIFILTVVLLTGLLTGCNNTSNDIEDEDDIRVIRVWLHKAEADDEGKIYRAIQLSSASSQIADGAQSLAQGTSEQTAAVE